MDLKVQIKQLEEAFSINETCIMAIERNNIFEDMLIADTMRKTSNLLDELIEALKAEQAEG